MNYSKNINIYILLLYLCVLFCWNLDFGFHFNSILYNRVETQFKKHKIDKNKNINFFIESMKKDEMNNDTFLFESFNIDPFQNIVVNAWWVSYLPFLQGILNTLSKKCENDYGFRLSSPVCRSRLKILSDAEITSSNTFIPMLPNISNYCDIDVCFNYEHVLHLVKDNMNYMPIGKVPILSHDNNKTFYSIEYTGRGICNPKYFPVLSIQYTMPNIEHFARSGFFSQQEMSGVVYVPSLSFYWDKTTSAEFKKKKFNSLPVSVISTFFVPERPRRKAFIEFLKHSGITNYNNINGISDLDGTMKVYDSHHVLLNIRQNDNLHTIEELRILPALSRRMIVISEIAPLVENLPYYSHVLWAKDWNEFPDLIQNVTTNYSFYYNKFFEHNLNFEKMLWTMKTNAFKKIKKSLNDIVLFKCNELIFEK